MEARIDVAKVNPDVMRALLGVEKVVEESRLDHGLLNLVKLRASQINGCAYCIDMHSKEARAAGESEQRLYMLDAWSEAPFYSERERAALAWTESVTLLSTTHVPDEVYAQVSRQFSKDELVGLTLAVAAINSWNRMAVSLRAVPGTYKPGQFKQAAA